MLIKELTQLTTKVEVTEAADVKMSSSINKTLLDIVKKHIPTFDTLEERGSDSLDFHDVGVVGLKRALQAAFLAGVKYAEADKK